MNPIFAFVAGQSRTGNTTEVAFFTTNGVGQIIDACPMIERLTNTKLHDDGIREFFVIRVPTKTIKASISKIMAKTEAKFTKPSNEEGV